MKEQVERYLVDYNGWLIRVIAKNPKSAKYKAWLKFKDVFGTQFLEFVRAAVVYSD